MTPDHHTTGPDDPAAGPEGAEPADRVRESVGHLQTAAFEVIAAARILLDAAEEVVSDPSSAAGLFSVLGDVARSAKGAEAGAAGERYDDGRDDGDGGGVQRIRVT